MYATWMDVGPEDVALAEGAGAAVFTIGEAASMRLGPFVKRTIIAHGATLSTAGHQEP